MTCTCRAARWSRDTPSRGTRRVRSTRNTRAQGGEAASQRRYGDTGEAFLLRGHEKTAAASLQYRGVSRAAQGLLQPQVTTRARLSQQPPPRHGTVQYNQGATRTSQVGTGTDVTCAVHGYAGEPSAVRPPGTSVEPFQRALSRPTEQQNGKTPNSSSNWGRHGVAPAGVTPHPQGKLLSAEQGAERPGPRAPEEERPLAQLRSEAQGYPLPQHSPPHVTTPET